MIARVKPDVTGSLYDYTKRRFVPLDHGREYDADDELVKAHPDVFDVEKPTKAKKERA